MKTAVNIRINGNIKKQAQIIAAQMGLNLSSLINVLLTKIVREQKLELTAYTENGFSAEFEDEILAATKNTDGDVVAKNSKKSEEFLNALMD